MAVSQQLSKSVGKIFHYAIKPKWLHVSYDAEPTRIAVRFRNTNVWLNLKAHLFNGENLLGDLYDDGDD